jgi:phosphoribosylglycinamide formyltransferase-1
MAPTHRIVLLVSGRGSNAEAIVQACIAEGWPAQVVALVSNRPGAGALEFAANHGIATAVVDHTLHASREAFDAELARVIDGFAPTLVVLAGFMRILSDGFVAHYAGRLLNIHPSLLPAFPGLHTHRRAIEAGCKLAGATVHFVTPALDHGPIVAQAVVPVQAGDTPEALSARVLAAEHRLYPLAVRWFVDGALQIGADGLVHHAGGAAQLLLPD